MKKILIFGVLFLLVACSGGSPKESGEFDWFEWDSESVENQEYNSLFMDALPSDFQSYHYNQWACNARNGHSLNILECWFSTGTQDQGTWSVKVVIEVEPSAEIARQQWQSHSELYYDDEAQSKWLESTPAALFSDANRVGDSKYVLHRAYGGDKEFHIYESYQVYENAKIFVMEDGVFSNPVIDNMEGVARNIVNIELGENR